MRPYVEMLCNVYFFSGVLFPAANHSISYIYDKDTGRWTKKKGSGPYFRVSVISGQILRKISGYKLEPPKSSIAVEQNSALIVDLSLSSRERNLTSGFVLDTSSDCSALLGPDTRTYMYGRKEKLDDGRIRYVASSTATVDLTSSVHLTGFDWRMFSVYQLVFSFNTFMVDEVLYTQSVGVSQFAADVVTVLELCLGFTLFSFLIQLLLLPSNAIATFDGGDRS